MNLQLVTPDKQRKQHHDSVMVYNAAQDWNLLPENIKSMKTMYGFRKEVKFFLNSLQTLKENSAWVM